jgi:hypothetical protein
MTIVATINIMTNASKADTVVTKQGETGNLPCVQIVTLASSGGKVGGR